MFHRGHSQGGRVCSKVFTRVLSSARASLCLVMICSWRSPRHWAPKPTSSDVMRPCMEITFQSILELANILKIAAQVNSCNLMGCALFTDMNTIKNEKNSYINTSFEFKKHFNLYRDCSLCNPFPWRHCIGSISKDTTWLTSWSRSSSCFFCSNCSSFSLTSTSCNLDPCSARSVRYFMIWDFSLL